MGNTVGTNKFDFVRSSVWWRAALRSVFFASLFWSISQLCITGWSKSDTDSFNMRTGWKIRLNQKGTQITVMPVKMLSTPHPHHRLQCFTVTGTNVSYNFFSLCSLLVVQVWWDKVLLSGLETLFLFFCVSFLGKNGHFEKLPAHDGFSVLHFLHTQSSAPFFSDASLKKANSRHCLLFSTYFSCITFWFSLHWRSFVQTTKRWIQ